VLRFDAYSLSGAAASTYLEASFPTIDGETVKPTRWAALCCTYWWTRWLHWPWWSRLHPGLHAPILLPPPVDWLHTNVSTLSSSCAHPHRTTPVGSYTCGLSPGDASTHPSSWCAECLGTVSISRFQPLGCSRMEPVRPHPLLQHHDVAIRTAKRLLVQFGATSHMTSDAGTLTFPQYPIRSSIVAGNNSLLVTFHRRNHPPSSSSY
jgi:hypothetical protein